MKNDENLTMFEWNDEGESTQSQESVKFSDVKQREQNQEPVGANRSSARRMEMPDFKWDSVNRSGRASDDPTRNRRGYAEGNQMPYNDRNQAFYNGPMQNAYGNPQQGMYNSGMQNPYNGMPDAYNNAMPGQYPNGMPNPNMGGMPNPNMGGMQNPYYGNGLAPSGGNVRNNLATGRNRRGDLVNSNGRSYIEFRGVTKNYKMGEMEIRALDGINFSIDQGEIVIVVGASGAGKSTILNIMGGMDRQTSGEIWVDGENISSFSDKQMVMYRRYDVGFVFQFYNLVPNLTAKENVELATQISQYPLDVDQTMRAVGLEERKDNFPSQLSGGEQQRVAIARALAKNPKLLLCDEPTGALDYNTGKSILKLLQDTARVNGMTVIIITHNYALTGIGDRVIKVKNGKIEAIETNRHPMDIADVEW